MKYVIYLRVSTDQQAQSGLGLEAQRDLCHKYISQQNESKFTKILEFVDEGYSGSLEMAKRPSLILALQALGEGDIFLVAKRDRLGRDVMVNLLIEREISKKKCKIVSASGDFKDDDDPASILMKRMIDSFAEYERLIIGVRTKSALQVKKKKGERVGYIPYGYQVTPDKKLEENLEEQKIIKIIHDLRESGLTYRAVTEKLEDLNILNRNKCFWSYVAVFNLFKKGMKFNGIKN